MTSDDFKPYRGFLNIVSIVVYKYISLSIITAMSIGSMVLSFKSLNMLKS